MRIFREKRLVRMAFPGRIFTRLKELDDGLGSDTVGIEASRKDPAASATPAIALNLLRSKPFCILEEPAPLIGGNGISE